MLSAPRASVVVVHNLAQKRQLGELDRSSVRCVDSGLDGVSVGGAEVEL